MPSFSLNAWNVGRWLQTFRAMPNESTAKTLIVGIAVCLACSVLVSSAAVFLKPLHTANQEREREQHIREIVARLPGIRELFATVEAHQVEARVVNLMTGDYISGIDPATYDQGKAAQDPRQSLDLPPERDIAQIKRRASYAVVYLVKHEGQTKLVILPVHGSGYTSTLYGYLAVDIDTQRVMGLRFYEHGETPGLGAEVDNPKWLDKWQGKRIWDEAGRLRLGVAKGRVRADNPAAEYEVDGLSGATQTGLGITHLLRFWLGDDGFGPYLSKVRLQRD